MRKLYSLLFIVFSLTAPAILNGQNLFFSDAGANRTVSTTGQRVLTPAKYRNVDLNVSAMKSFLWSLPNESNFIYSRTNAPVLTLPMPDGSTARFRVWESSVQEPGLEAKFPEIKTFAGQGIDDPYATIRFDFNPYFGFSAQILSSKTGRIFIDPYARGDVNHYMSYYMRDYGATSQFTCGVTEESVGGRSTEEVTEAGPCLGTQLRTFRLAFACTGEFAQAVGGGVAGPTHAAIVLGVNRLTQVYEDELAIRLVLIADNNLIEYLNPATDPWSNNGSIAELNSITGNINTALAGVGGASAYDVGHLGCTASNAGVAGLGVVCGASKGRGLTGGLNPVGDPYYIDYVAHELGHQFNGGHTFNSDQCASTGGSYEPGSGTTIMAYAGICGATENIQPNSDPIFHAISFDQIGNFVSTGGGSSCPAVTSTGNTLPVVTISTANNLTIPINTPFTLDATATDADGDAVTYNWEGWDIGAQGSWPSAASSTTRPLFRTRVSKTTGSRTFPDIRVIVANYPGTGAPSAMDGLRGEVLPTVARAMKFRLTVRDNRAGGGGVVSAGDGCQNATIFQVNTSGSTPFTVSSPNGGESYPAGSTQTITWNNAGTTAAPFNVANVRITMSTDGGLTYPHLVTASTANDGSEALAIPSVAATTTARIKVEAIGNIFFDISNANFSITVPVNGYSFGTATTGTAACPAAGPINSTLPVNFQGTYAGPVSVTYVSGAPAGTNVTISPNSFTANGTATVSLNNTSALAPGTYTVVVQGTGPAPGITQTANVSFTVSPGSGPTITGQPANATVCSGQNASFTVTATGTYQWQVSTAAVPAFTNIGGATAATLNLTAVTAGMSGNQYRCIVSGQCGSTTSNAATLTVNVAPAVTTNPTSQAVCSGSSVTFTAAGTGTPTPTYQWQVSTLAVPAFTNIGGATSATYTIASTTLAMNGDQYRCVLTNSCGTVNTTAATLTVNSSITVSSNPTSQTVCEGVNVSFSATASGSGLNYQWQVSTDGGGSFNNIVAAAPYSGTTTPTMTITGVPPGFNNYRYRCVISNGVCTPGTSTAATLTVNTFPVVTTPPANATICAGAAHTFSVAATTGVGVLSYQWQVSTDGGTTYSSIAGATTSSFAQTAIPVGQNGYRFRVIVTAGCGSVTSAAAVLTVNAFPVISFGSNPVNVCVSDAAFSVTATPTGTWSGTGVTAGGTFTPSAAGVGVRTLTYTAANAGCTSTATTIVNVLACAERQRLLTDVLSATVFPVPNDGNFNIRMNSSLYTRLGVRVFGADGKLYMTKTFTGLMFGSVVSIDASRLAAGTYFLQLYNDEGEFTQRGVGVTIFKP